MAIYPIMPLPTDAFSADTMPMTPIEVGAYTLILIAMWRAGGVLPNDDKRLARIARLSGKQWLRVRPAFALLLHVEHGMLTSNTLLASLSHVQKRSQLASTSARRRWLKNNEPRHALAMPTECVRNANQIEEESLPNLSERAREPETSAEAGSEKDSAESKPVIAVSGALLTSKLMKPTRGSAPS